MRKKIIAGNWKMNIKPSETAALVKGVVEATKDFTNVEVVCCTPAIDVPAAVAAAAGTHVGVGAENCHWKESGAYTGEISTGMLLDAGAKYVIIGHSERRQYFGETDETVNLRARAAIAAGLTAIVCVGETLEERDAGKLGARRRQARGSHRPPDERRSQGRYGRRLREARHRIRARVGHRHRPHRYA